MVLLLYAARATGRSNVPARGPLIIAANHTGFLDGGLVLSLAPRPRLRSRLVVDFGPPVVLDLPEGLPGRARLDLATQQCRARAGGPRARSGGAARHPAAYGRPPDLLD